VVIGVWLASGALLPAFFLIRLTYRWLAASKIGPKGLHALSGWSALALAQWSASPFSWDIRRQRG
jgi:hypothetical protein